MDFPLVADGCNDRKCCNFSWLQAIYTVCLSAISNSKLRETIFSKEFLMAFGTSFALSTEQHPFLDWTMSFRLSFDLFYRQFVTVDAANFSRSTNSHTPTPKVCITAILLRLISFDCGQNGDKETQKKYHKNKLDAAKNSALCIWKKSAMEMHPWLPQPLPSPPLCSSKTKRQLKNRNRWMWDYKMVS